MKILYKAVTADVQITTQAAWLVGATIDSDVEYLKVYDEDDNSKTDARMAFVCDTRAHVMFPLPGVYCANGIYADIDHGNAVIYYYH